MWVGSVAVDFVILPKSGSVTVSLSDTGDNSGLISALQSVPSANVTLQGRTLTKDGNMKFVGQYSPFSITDQNINEILYVASGNKIGYSSKNRTLKCFRAHFWVKPNGTQQAARMINIDFSDGETTQIATTNYANDTNSDGAWYDLQGRKVTQPTKGLYIVNGKKMVIK